MARESGSEVVDLRSDTVTRPTAEMRRAMADAEVGDDGFGEDPTIAELETMYAARVGKDAAVFVPSGTMANQIAVRVLARPGTAVVAGRREHVVAFEAGAAAHNAGVQFHLVDDATGVVEPSDVAYARSLADFHQPQVSLVCIENTHMAAGGVPWTLGQLDALAAAAGDVPVHMDGARLFNAEVATGVPAGAMASRATTVMSCLSKGLCAPVGSLLAGPAAVIEAGRTERKRLGGAMRQAGILAAAGIIALRTMVDRLGEDHLHARRLAQAVADRWPDAGADPERTATNIVVFSPPAAQDLLAHLEAHGVLADMIAPGVVRLVTHHDVDDEGTERALVAIGKAP
ncbi:MAG: threonine aldolase family protein [Acidimicrobiales bacterium]